MNTITSVAKFLDQPIVKARITKASPKVLIGGATLYGAYDSATCKGNKKKRLIKNAFTLTGTVSAAIIATFGFTKGKFKIKGLIDEIKPIEAKQATKRFIDRFRRMLEKSTSKDIDSTTQILFKNAKINKYLDKAIDKPLSPKDIKRLHELVGDNKVGKKLLEKLIPKADEIKSKEMFKKIGELTALGAVPVAGGIVGGTVGDMFTEKDWKKKLPNKAKEGLYQLLANIVLCNVGAGAALAGIELAQKSNSKTIKNIAKKPLTKIGAMIGGLTLTGIIGGSALANLISKKVIDKPQAKHKGLYNERHPEALDMALHVDDVATVGVLSGLSWIEPVLPIFYAVSGYRAGMGYRNGKNESKDCKNHGYNQLRSLSNQEIEKNGIFSKFV